MGFVNQRLNTYAPAMLTMSSTAAMMGICALMTSAAWPTRSRSVEMMSEYWLLMLRHTTICRVPVAFSRPGRMRGSGRVKFKSPSTKVVARRLMAGVLSHCGTERSPRRLSGSGCSRHWPDCS